MNCKPGDVAIIVRAMVPENIGKLCEVLHAAPDWQGRPTWLVRVFTPATAVSRSGFSSLGLRCEADVPDANLRPIRPGDISDEEVRDLYLPKVPEAA